ncbi:MAG: RNA 2',3'-cyclic phosphodiesterase [Candidatus Methanomethylophilaceae archaeon]|nr:RNA 2',3'-cyclic phosphodiesterase [Candidatus Methanomethylophilaceae archaeon]
MRAFVAVKIPDGPSLYRPLEGLSAAGGLRVYGTGDLHITLSFIGEIGQERLRDVSDTVERAARGIGPFDITVGSIGSFPGKSGPRIVWAGARSGGKLEMLAERTAAELDEGGIGHDMKKFVPHITLARARDERGAPSASSVIERYSGTDFLTFTCRRITVFGSELTPSGAVHTPVSEIAL